MRTRDQINQDYSVIAMEYGDLTFKVEKMMARMGILKEIMSKLNSEQAFSPELEPAKGIPLSSQAESFYDKVAEKEEEKIFIPLTSGIDVK